MDAQVAAKCQHCGRMDSQIRIILECELPGQEILAKLPDSADLERRVLSYILCYAFDLAYPEVQRLWLGSWSDTLLRDALRHESHAQLPLIIPYVQAKSIQQVIVRLTTCLVRTVADMMRVRCSFARPTAEITPNKRRKFQHGAYEQVVAQSETILIFRIVPLFQDLKI